MSRVLSVSALRLPAQSDLRLPGSKSHANRAIVCAALANGKTVIRGATPCDDVLVMVENLAKMGFSVRWLDQECGELEVRGGIPAAGSGVLDCHNAGTTIRFLSSVAAVTPGDWTLTGDEYMQRRPIADLADALQSLGVSVTTANGCPPLMIRGGAISGSSVTLNATVSSQYLTSLLLISPQLPRGLSVTIQSTLTSEGYVDLTEKVMRDFGVIVKKEKNTFIVQKSGYRAVSAYEIEGDWSAAGAWLVLNALTGSKVVLPNLRADSDQSDRLLPQAIATLGKKGDVTLDCGDIPDQVMNLCVLAAYRKGTTVLTNIANLRKKECDRIHVIASELARAGADISERGDELVIKGKASLPAADVTLDPHADHRMAMAFAILGLVRGGIRIRNPECTAKSYPSFFRDLETVRQSGKPVSIVGMRGAGKSSLGRRLAKKLGAEHLDSDHLFQDAEGPIRPYIEKHGWDAFRKKEEDVIASAIRPGTVLSLGGGALGSARTRKLIRERTVAVWLQASEPELLKRLSNEKRPRLTDLPLKDEIRKFLLERGPHYREVAKVTVSPRIRFKDQTSHVLEELPRLLRSR